jgi:hypothetical protein
MATVAKHLSQLPMGSLTTMLPKPYTVSPPLAYNACMMATTPSVARVST